MPDSATSPSLRELSEAATQGLVTVHEGQPCDHSEDAGGGFTLCFGGTLRLGSGAEYHRIAYAAEIWPDLFPDEYETAFANIHFLARLWNDHRAGHLLDAPTVAEREARARAEGPGWQTMETAPKDGTVVDLFNGYRHTGLYWDVEQRPGGGWSSVRDREEHWRDRRGVYAPTAWMLAPAHPALIPEARHEV